MNIRRVLTILATVLMAGGLTAYVLIMGNTFNEQNEFTAVSNDHFRAP